MHGQQYTKKTVSNLLWPLFCWWNCSTCWFMHWKCSEVFIFGAYENLSSLWNSRYIRCGNIKCALTQQGSPIPSWLAMVFDTQNLITDVNEWLDSLFSGILHIKIWIPMPGRPDSTSKSFLDSGIRITLYEEKSWGSLSISLAISASL